MFSALSDMKIMENRRDCQAWVVRSVFARPIVLILLPKTVKLKLFLRRRCGADAKFNPDDWLVKFHEDF